MGAKESKPITLRILVDKKKERVVFAEADKDFVDILFSFLTLPVGTVVRLIRNQSKPSVLGCMNNLYNAIENLEVGLFQSDTQKAMVLRPNNSSEHLCRKLKFNIDDTEPIKYGNRFKSSDVHFNLIEEDVYCKDDQYGGVFVNGKAKFMISDDLKVMPLSTSTSIQLLTTLGVKDVDALEERFVKVGTVEVLALLRLSLLSMTPLSDLFLPKHADCSGVLMIDPTDQILSGRVINPLSGWKEMTMKIMVRKSDNKVLYGEAQEDFIDYLISLLALPLGAIVKLLDRTPSLGCISNLYTSVQELSVDRHIKKEFIKTKLLSPQLSAQFGYKIRLLGINKNFYPQNTCKFLGSDSFGMIDDMSQNMSLTFKQIGVEGFIQGPANFFLTDDLNVTPLSPISSIFVLDKLKGSISDMEEQVVSFGREEALKLLEASLTSTSALNSVFNLTLKKPKIEKGGSSSNTSNFICSSSSFSRLKI